MRDTKHLQLRHQTWHCVRDVPRPLREVMGRKRLTVSLQTHDLRLAQARRYEALVSFECAIEAARRKVGPDAIVEAGLAWKNALARIEAGDPEAIKVHGGHFDPYADQHRERPRSPQQVAREHAELELSNHIEHVAETEGDAAASTLADVAHGRATPLMHHVDAWLAEGGPKGALTPRTKAQYRHDLGRLETWAKAAGVPCTVEAFTRRIAGRYVMETITGAGVDPSTGNRWVSAASAYWRWLVKRAGVEMNPWAGQSIAKAGAHQDDDGDKRPFTDDELRTLLAGDPGAELADLIRVAALSGMRLEEVYRLTVADCADGCFAVRVSKTAAGRRRVPIHPDLAGIVARRCKGKRPDAFLFHEAGAAPEGRQRSMPISKAFGRYRQAQGVHERAEGKRHSAVDFHSLRRWFATAAERAGQPPHVISTVLGHREGRQGMTLGRYSAGPADPQMRAVVEAVKLP